jgi:hypothetical protein
LVIVADEQWRPLQVPIEGNQVDGCEPNSDLLT